MSKSHLNPDNEIDKENLDFMTIVIVVKYANVIVISSDNQVSLKKMEIKKTW